MKVDMVLTDGLLVYPDAEIERASLIIEDGRIVGKVNSTRGVEAREVIDASGMYVLPGIIDGHSHFGHGDGRGDFSSPSEDFLTETRTAALGGVTTIFTYFRRLDSYESVVPEHLAFARDRAYIDFGLHLVLQREAHLNDLGKYFDEFGIPSFKIFMAYKGAEGKQIGIEGADDGLLYEAFRQLSTRSTAVCAVHCENMDIIQRLRQGLIDNGRRDLAAWSDARPPEAEAEAIRRATYLAGKAGARMYIPHLSCEEGLVEAMLSKQRFGSDRILVETCPHYLTHTRDSELGALAKVNTPLRTRVDQEALWSGIREGHVDAVASDHVAVSSSAKSDIWTGRPGLPGTATLLPVLLSEGVNKGRIPMQRVAALLSANPAKIWGIYPQKGSLLIGSDADITVVDLNLEQQIRSSKFGSAADFSIYDGWRLKGWPTLTMVRGMIVMRDGQIVGNPGFGEYLSRPNQVVESRLGRPSGNHHGA